MDCKNCVYYSYDKSTDWGECNHPDFDNPDECPGEYSKEDAKADAKYNHLDRY